MILMKNRIEEILKPGVIVEHFQREEALKREGADPNAFLYQVCGIATNTETEKHMVIYQALYGDHEIFVRPLEEFIGTRASTISGIKIYKPRFIIYTDPVDVTPGAQAAGIVEKESEEIKKLRKKVKRLQSDLKKARKEAEESLKKPSLKKRPTNKNDGIINKGIEYVGGIEVPVAYAGAPVDKKPIMTMGVRKVAPDGTTYPVISRIDPEVNSGSISTPVSSTGEHYRSIATTIKSSEEEAVSESEEAEESARFLGHKKESK